MDSPAQPSADDSPVRWRVVATRADYSLRAPLGRFAALEDAESLAEALRAQGYRDVQVEPIGPDEGS